MPIYPYACQRCESIVHLPRSVADRDAPGPCPTPLVYGEGVARCGGQLVRKLHTVSVVIPTQHRAAK